MFRTTVFLWHCQWRSLSSFPAPACLLAGLSVCLCVSRCLPTGAVGIDPSAAAEAAPKPTAETIDSNRLESEEGKNTPDVFVRKETVRGGSADRGRGQCTWPDGGVQCRFVC